MRQAARQALLLERDGELAAIDVALARAREGHGGVVAIEAPAGLGKTALIAAAQEWARDAGMRTLAGRGLELERRFTFGILRQVYEPLLQGADEPERERLLQGAAAGAGPALGIEREERAGPADPIFAVAHGIYWLTANLAADGPLLVAIDDAQWADTASLRCAMYLAARIEDLPVALVIAARPGEPDAPEDMLATLVGEPSTKVLSPALLSVEATRRLIGERSGTEADPEFAAAAHELTGGNPFFVSALAADLGEQGIQPDEEGARLLPSLTPDAVGRAVLVRLIRLGDEAVILAQAVAVLGDETPLPQAAELAGLAIYDAAAAATRLAHADILRSADHLAFTHPLVREAVREETPAHLRTLLHAGAARLLHAAGAAAEQVGSQLLRTPPARDAWVAERLVEAGESAESRGDLDNALAFLTRALQEPPPAERRSEVLHSLGRTELRAGVNDGYAHLDEAAELAEPSQRAAIGFDLARAMMLAGRPEAVDALARATTDLPPGERADAVRKETELIALGRMSPATATHVRRRADALAPVAERREPGWEAALGVLAGQAYLRRDPAPQVAEMARVSLDERRARGEDPSESAGFMNACHVLIHAGEYAEAERHLTHVVESARLANAPIGFVTAASFRARAALRRGDLAKAEADARLALSAADAAFRQPTLPGTLGVLIEVLVERGELDEADRMLGDAHLTGDLLHLAPFNDLIYARGRLRHAQGRAGEAVADLEESGEAAIALGVEAPGPYPWRQWAALTHLGVGHEDEASALAAEALGLSRAYDAPYDLGLALRTAGLVEGGDEGIALLSEAVEVLEPSPAVLELARARTDMGAALRRAGRRQEARAVLREALDGASRCGATALAERARSELVTAGARPRRERSSGQDALTASERRVAELALEGLTNRQIAETLFVTTSTVEKHLASAYSKLDIAGRAELPTAFTPS